MKLTILMPCLNEAETLETCILKAKQFLESSNLQGEVLIADNGSSDGSPDIAQKLGARVVVVKEKGYGAALLGGIESAKGEWIIMGDADASYDFSALELFVKKLQEGFDLVMGNRFQGGIVPGAMPTLHRYFGNPLLSGIGRLFFKIPIKDFHCGLRGFKLSAIQELNLQTTGMEFASEMVIKSYLAKLTITEVPTVLHPDGRSRPPHLRSWRDGWRHLRFMLLFSPRWLFLFPGLALMLFGAMLGARLMFGPLVLPFLTLDVHTLLYCGFAVLVGFQSVLFAVLTKIYGITHALLPEDKRLNTVFRFVNLEVGLASGVFLIGAGVFGTLGAFWRWETLGFGELNPGELLRIIVPAGLAFVMGAQTILFSFFLSVLGLKRKA